MLIIVIAALVILGPERLPGAMKWTANALKQARDYASGASTKLKDEFGTDLSEFREPLKQLNELRGMSPRAAITKHLFDGDSSFIDTVTGAVNGAVNDVKAPFTGAGDGAAHPTPGQPAAAVQPSKPLSGNPTQRPGPSAPQVPEMPPIDPDAT